MRLASCYKAKLPVEEVSIDDALRIINSLYIYKEDIPWTWERLQEPALSNACMGNVCVDNDNGVFWVWQDGISVDNPPERCLKITGVNRYWIFAARLPRLQSMKV